MSNMPMHDRRTGETSTVAQHMGAQGGRTASQHADYFHNETWMGGPAHADAHRAVMWSTSGHREEAPRAVSQNHPEHGPGVLMQHGPGMNTFHSDKDVKELHFVDQHDVDKNFPSAAERSESYRASLPHDTMEHPKYGRF